MDVLFLYRGQQFVWDGEKAAANYTKHGIRFQAACEVFFDPAVREIDAGVEDEVRLAAIGAVEKGQLLFVVHLFREYDWIRIISARLVTATERKFYEDSD